VQLHAIEDEVSVALVRCYGTVVLFVLQLSCYIVWQLWPTVITKSNCSAQNYEVAAWTLQGLGEGMNNWCDML